MEATPTPLTSPQGPPKRSRKFQEVKTSEFPTLDNPMPKAFSFLVAGYQSDTQDNWLIEEQEDVAYQKLFEQKEQPGSSPSVQFSREDYRQVWLPWHKSVIVKVLGRAMGYGFLYPRLKLKWAKKGDLELIDREFGFFIASFSSLEDYEMGISGGPWISCGHYVTIREWQPMFNSDSAEIGTTAIWIRLPGLPIELFDKIILQ